MSRPFIPTEEEFDLLLEALSTYERDAVTRLFVNQSLKQMKGLDDEEAFVTAFSKGKDKEIEQVCVTEARTINDKVILVYAKILQFRNYVREQTVSGAVEDLIK